MDLQVAMILNQFFAMLFRRESSKKQKMWLCRVKRNKIYEKKKPCEGTLETLTTYPLKCFHVESMDINPILHNQQHQLFKQYKSLGL